MSTQDLFDLTWENIDSTRNNNVSFTVDQINVTFLIATRHVPHACPIVPEDFGRRMRLLPISIKQIGRTYVKFPYLSVVNFVAVIVTQTDIRAGKRKANALRLSKLIRWS